MKPQSIRVRAKVGILVSHPRALPNGSVAQYVDRSVNHDAHKAGDEDLEVLYPILGGTDVKRVPIQEFNEVYRAVKFGDLWAADVATAAYCGVPFDPTFGGAVKPVESKKPASPTTEK